VSLATVPDLLRLLAVPVLGWAAVSDVRTRRVSNRTWPPLAGLAIVLLIWDFLAVLGDPAPFAVRLFALRVAVSGGLVMPRAYLWWRMGGFGGADAKAVMVIEGLFQT
jgi:preflagellin peptidase FlaK